MNILNLSHPLTEGQVAQIAALTGEPVGAVVVAPTHFDADAPFAPQVAALLGGLGIAPDRWQTEAWLVVLPSLNYIAAAILAELHGRMGHFPAILRLRPINGVVTTYEVAEIINLEAMRQAARARR